MSSITFLRNKSFGKALEKRFDFVVCKTYEATLVFLIVCNWLDLFIDLNFRIKQSSSISFVNAP